MKLYYVLIVIFTLFVTDEIIAQDRFEDGSEVIMYSSFRQVKGDKLVITDSMVVQINDRIGEGAAEIDIVYSKGEKPSIGYAWIEDMQGNIVRKLKNNEIKDRSYISDGTLYQDDFVRSFQLKHNQYPYRLVFSYKITKSKFFQIADIDFSHDRKPVREGRLIVEVPSGRKIKFQQRNISNPQVEHYEDVSTYIWNFAHDARPYQLNAPYTDEKAPYLQVLPVDFHYGLPGSMQSWSTFGDWIFRLNAGRDNLPDSEKQKIDELLAGISDDREKAKLLYYYMQDRNRYINVSINIGGLQSYPAEYVCRNRYGDCKALTNYTKAILKYAGVESFYTLINLDEQVKDIDPQFASQAFNHVILTVPIDKDTLYLECTSRDLPFGYIHSSIQNRKALLVAEQNSRLIEIPAQSGQDVLCSQKYEVQIGHASEDIAGITLTQRGSDFESAAYLNKSEKKDVIEKYIVKNIPANILSFIEQRVEKQSRDSAYIQLNAECRISPLSKLYGNNMVINPFGRKFPSYDAPENRTQTVRLDYPVHYSDTIIYNIAAGVISKAPDDIYLITPFGMYAINYKAEGSRLLLYKNIHIFAGKYGLDEYEAFFKFMQAVRNNENKKIYLELQ